MPTRARCMTMMRTVQRSWLLLCRSGTSKLASSFHTGAELFSATVVEYFSLPSWMMAYASLVPALPFDLRALACRTVTWTCVGNQVCDCTARDILPPSPAAAVCAERGGAHTVILYSTGGRGSLETTCRRSHPSVS
ncbi:hypothetical protein GDO81_023850 [Engystomops pustulosus]|uniref:Secreted protein n=1 Tax=Engystomops pustulosus TaxID=76066 RepID=A0AAV6YK22_ENGPU|nr:hypothetical protein GDO81_023850 [Engystomops pustulosus]